MPLSGGQAPLVYPDKEIQYPSMAKGPATSTNSGVEARGAAAVCLELLNAPSTLDRARLINACMDWLTFSAMARMPLSGATASLVSPAGDLKGTKGRYTHE